MGRHRFHCSLRWSDMDAFGHVNNTTFFTYLEEARVDLLFVTAGESVARERLSSGIVVARHEIDYTSPLVFRPEPVPIDVWVSHLGTSSFTLRYEILDEGGPVYAKAGTVLVPYDVDAARPRRLSEEERAALEPYVVAE
ncbi:MAG TPA: thioesterase family protein [Actinomycetes bacterium]|nr:thioesterase family protein [Actinomycetes bacterium]